MKRIRATAWDDLDAIPEGEWVEVVGGLDLKVTHPKNTRVGARVVIPLNPADARALRPRKGEILEAPVRGRNLELVRGRSKRAARP